jgi:hypothetical protein
VKKSGRTTGLSRSSIVGLNATISVTYDNECAGGTAFTKTFTSQIVIGNKGSKFLNSGDSGSLMVEGVATNPRAIGLLFAGSSTDAIANPINQASSARPWSASRCSGLQTRWAHRPRARVPPKQDQYSVSQRNRSRRRKRLCVIRSQTGV